MQIYSPLVVIIVLVIFKQLPLQNYLGQGFSNILFDCVLPVAMGFCCIVVAVICLHCKKCKEGKRKLTWMGHSITVYLCDCFSQLCHLHCLACVMGWDHGFNKVSILH